MVMKPPAFPYSVWRYDVRLNYRYKCIPPIATMFMPRSLKRRFNYMVYYRVKAISCCFLQPVSRAIVGNESLCRSLGINSGLYYSLHIDVASGSGCCIICLQYPACLLLKLIAGLGLCKPRSYLLTRQPHDALGW